MTYSEEPDLKCSQFFTSLEHQIWQQLVHILAWLSWLELSFSHSASPAISIYLSVGFCMHSASPMAPNTDIWEHPHSNKSCSGLLSEGNTVERKKARGLAQERCILVSWAGSGSS